MAERQTLRNSGGEKKYMQDKVLKDVPSSSTVALQVSGTAGLVSKIPHARKRPKQAGSDLIS